MKLSFKRAFGLVLFLFFRRLRRYDELESAIGLMKSDLANVTALFETTKKAHTKLQRENATTVAELGETKRSLDVTKGELTEAKVEAGAVPIHTTRFRAQLEAWTRETHVLFIGGGR